MADFAWIKATKADKMGNFVFKGTSYNFNAIMGTMFASPAFNQVMLNIEQKQHTP